MICEGSAVLKRHSQPDAVVELPAGSLRDREVNVGDRLYLLEPSGKRVRLFVDDLRGIGRVEAPLAA